MMQAGRGYRPCSPCIPVEKKKRREHSLTGRITMELMRKAFKNVKRNRGAAGVDKQSIQMFEANLNRNLEALMKQVKTGTYQPIPLRRVYPIDALNSVGS